MKLTELLEFDNRQIEVDFSDKMIDQGARRHYGKTAKDVYKMIKYYEKRLVTWNNKKWKVYFDDAGYGAFDFVLVEPDDKYGSNPVATFNPFTKKIEELLDERTEITLEDTQDFHEEFGYLAYSLCENDLFEAEYQGRKVKLNKPTRGDVKKFKVYVKNDKGNVIKVNFGHGGSSAKSKGEKTMKIRKSNPKARKSFRARHNCDNPGPKTKARYWSCKAW